MQKLQDIQRAMELLSACQGPARNIDEAAKHRYQFWDTQPVPKLRELLCLFSFFLPKDKADYKQNTQKGLTFTYITCFILQIRTVNNSNTFLLKIEILDYDLGHQ